MRGHCCKMKIDDADSSQDQSVRTAVVLAKPGVEWVGEW